jgi:lysophospholipase L1-like esterase
MAKHPDLVVIGGGIIGLTSAYLLAMVGLAVELNAWIRSSGELDGVIDFDAIARDPSAPARLSSAVDGGDHLHPSAAGYRIMADAIDLGLFR